MYKSAQNFLQSFESIGLSVKEKFKIYFQDGHRGGPLGFRIRANLATFDVQVAPILRAKFQVNWPFG